MHKNIIFVYSGEAIKISHMLPEKVMKIFACSLNDFFINTLRLTLKFFSIYQVLHKNILHSKTKDMPIQKKLIFFFNQKFALLPLGGNDAVYYKVAKHFEESNGSLYSNWRMLYEFRVNLPFRAYLLCHCRSPAWFPSIAYCFSKCHISWNGLLPSKYHLYVCCSLMYALWPHFNKLTCFVSLFDYSICNFSNSNTFSLTDEHRSKSCIWDSCLSGTNQN